MPTIVIILLAVYLLSMLIVGAIHWAAYQDSKKYNYEVKMEDKVMKLYVVPLCPIVNSLVALGIITDYFGM